MTTSLPDVATRTAVRLVDLHKSYSRGAMTVPAVRAIFQSRFGTERIETGGEFESIAAGLALIGREPDLDLWSEKAG